MPTAIAVTSADLVLPPHRPADAHRRRAQSPDDQPLDAALADMQRLLEQHGYVDRPLSRLHPGAPRPAAAHRPLRPGERPHRAARARPAAARARRARTAVAAAVASATSARACSPPPPGCSPTTSTPAPCSAPSPSSTGSRSASSRTPSPGCRAPSSPYSPTPRPQLVKVGARTSLAGPEFATQLLVAPGASCQSDWVTGDPRARLAGPGRAARPPLPAESAALVGHRQAHRVRRRLPDVSVLYQLVSSVRREECHWCGLELIGDRCGFCSAPRSPAREPDAATGVLNHGAPTHHGT